MKRHETCRANIIILEASLAHPLQAFPASEAECLALQEPVRTSGRPAQFLSTGKLPPPSLEAQFGYYSLGSSKEIPKRGNRGRRQPGCFLVLLLPFGRATRNWSRSGRAARCPPCWLEFGHFHSAAALGQLGLRFIYTQEPVCILRIRGWLLPTFLFVCLLAFKLLANPSCHFLCSLPPNYLQVCFEHLLFSCSDYFVKATPGCCCYCSYHCSIFCDSILDSL